MNIVVCMKQVPDTETRIQIKDDQIDTSNINYVVNPYDEYGVEEALQIKERLGEGKITILCLGPERSKEAIRSCLALGSDEAVHLLDDKFEGSNPYATGLILSKALANIDYDLIFCGKQGVDTDHAQVGIALAELLNIPHVAVVTKLTISDDKTKATCEREIEGAKEVVETTLPAVICAQKGLNEPRYASLKGIMGAKKKPMEDWDAAKLGLEPGDIGVEGSKTRFVKFSPPPERLPGKIIEGEDASQTAPKLVKLLREEAKII